MKKTYILLALLMILATGINAATYYSCSSGTWSDNAGTNTVLWSTDPGCVGSTVLLADAALAAAGHTYYIRNNITQVTGTASWTNTSFIVNAGASFTRSSTLQYAHITVYGTLSLGGNAVFNAGHLLEIYGTANVTGEIQNARNINVYGAGSLTSGQIRQTAAHVTTNITGSNITTGAIGIQGILSNYGTVSVTGNISGGATSILSNEGSLTVNGNASNINAFNTSGAGTTIVKGNISGTTINVSGTGSVTAGTTGNSNTVNNSNISVGAGSSLTIKGDLIEDAPADKTFVNDGTANITGKIAIGSTTNTGSLTVAYIDKMNNPETVTVTNSGIMTVTVAQTYNNGERRTITNSGTLNFISSLQLNGATNVLTNTGTLNVATSLDINSGSLPTIGNASIGTNLTVNGATMDAGALTVGGALTARNTTAPVTIGSSTISGNIVLETATLTTKAGSTSTANKLSTSNGITLNNNGALTFSTSSGTLAGNVAINNSGILTFPGDLRMDNTSSLNNTGTTNIGGVYTMKSNTRYVNGLPASSKINVGSNLSIDVNEHTKSINYGTVNVGGAMEYRNGTLDNMSGAKILINGTGSFLNSTVHIANAGSIDLTQELKVTNTSITNSIAGVNGSVSAHGGIALENSGCIVGGSVDYWGTITHSLHPCPGASCYDPSNPLHNCPLALRTILPVELIGITAQKSVDGNLIRWIVLSETNNDYFQIEASIDGLNYKLLETIDGAGNSATEIQYEFLHSQPSIGVNYYRLSQTDFDGQKRYFAPIAVHYSNMEALIYPTVIRGDDMVTVRLSDVTEAVAFQIVCQEGKVLYTGSISKLAELPSDMFQFGLNQLIIGSDNSIITTSIVKQ